MLMLAQHPLLVVRMPARSITLSTKLTSMAEITHFRTHFEVNSNVSSWRVVYLYQTVLWISSKTLRAKSRSLEDPLLSTEWIPILQLIRTGMLFHLRSLTLLTLNLLIHTLWPAALSLAIVSQLDSDPSLSLTLLQPIATPTPVMVRTSLTLLTSTHPPTRLTRMVTHTVTATTPPQMPMTTTTRSLLFQADQESTPADQCEMRNLSALQKMWCLKTVSIILLLAFLI